MIAVTSASVVWLASVGAFHVDAFRAYRYYIADTGTGDLADLVFAAQGLNPATNGTHPPAIDGWPCLRAQLEESIFLCMLGLTVILICACDCDDHAV
jgi:hypothetical protein